MRAGNRLRRRGSSMVEGALTIGAFSLVLFGVIEFGRATYVLNWTSRVARDASRYASLRGGTSSTPVGNTEVLAFVKSQAVGIDQNSISTTTTFSPNNQPGSSVTILVTYAYAPMIGGIVGSSLSLKGRSQSIVLR